MPLPFPEQPLLLDLDPRLLLLQGALPLEVELELLRGALILHLLLPAPLLGLAVEGHVAGEAADGTADQRRVGAVAENGTADAGAGRSTRDRAHASRTGAAAARAAREGENGRRR